MSGPDSESITPINARQRAEVQARTRQFVDLAAQLYRRDVPAIEVHFDLSGHTAGLFEVYGERCRIRYNPWVFAKHYDDNLATTIPHEVAHYVVHRLYRRRVRPHGPEWRGVMRDFGVSPDVTFTADLSGVPSRQQKQHRYMCGCQEHLLSTTRHNRIRQGQARYHCVNCEGLLEYAPLAEAVD